MEPTSDPRERRDARRPLVVGAGPVGVACALFLARRGIAARVVERRLEPSRRSKALAVNPRSLELLEASGVTARLLELGRPIRGAVFHGDGGVLGELPLAGAHPRYPFLLALSQACTERVLTRALEAAGGAVERGVELVGCEPLGAAGVEAHLVRAAGGARETTRVPWLIGADGAHSTVRRALGIDFPGSDLAGELHLADAPLATRLASDRAHVFASRAGGFRFLLPVVDPEAAEERGGAPCWRVVSDREDPLEGLRRAEPTGPPVWSSSFTIGHRTAAAFASGRALLAGDAAHVHSPLGARGMNLGLEDAWVLAELAGRGRLDDYAAARRAVDGAVVRRVERLTRLVLAQSGLARRLRAAGLWAATRVPPLRRRMRATLTGQDHASPLTA